MSSDWTTCEGGACVQYRTEGAAVYVRNSADPERVIGFTVAEWEAFVAGLTAPIRDWDTAERAELKTQRAEARHWARHGYEIGQRSCTWSDHGVAPKWLTEGHDPASLTGTPHAGCLAAEERLAAENARLRQHLTAAEDERDRYVAAVARARRERATAIAEAKELRTELAITIDQRDAAIAEAAVLRHRDRRTQDVVDAAAIWFEHEPPFGGTAASGRLFNAVGRYLEAWETGLSATESAEQAPAEALATDGAEPRGEAQGAAGASWLAQRFHETYERLAPSFGYETREASAKPWADVPEQNRRLMIAVCAELLPAIEERIFPAVWLDPAPDWTDITEHVRGRVPRVWNAGDPEPEGVAKVTDSGGELWTRHRDGQWTHVEQGFVAARAQWDDLAYGDGPLTEVLPEPAPDPRDVTHATPWTNTGTGGVKVTMDNADGRFVPTAGEQIGGGQ